jgi:uncharacterized phage protein gp47/JayE
VAEQDPHDIPPLDVEDIDSLRSRCDADANAGVDPGSREWVDTTPGLPFYALTQPVLLAVARARDLIAVEFMAAALLSRAYGPYLDEHGEGLGIPRSPATAAAGKVVFTAPNGTLISTGFEVAIVQADVEQEPPNFVTTEGTPVGGVAAIVAPFGMAAIPRPGGGNLAGGTYHYRVTSLVGTLETTPSAALSVTLSAQGRISLSWPTVPGASGYRIYRGPSAGATVRIAEVQTITYDDFGATASVTAPPVANGTGGAWALTVQADEEGPDGNVAAGTITIPESQLVALTSITNPYALTGGADVEDDESYRRKLLAATHASAIGASTAADLESMSLENPFVGYAKVEPLWNGANTARVILTDHANDPVPADVVTAVQNDLDPIPGQGAGRALIGLNVTVTTTSSVAITVVATVTTETTHSLDGTGGTLPVRDAIYDAVGEYINGLEPGEDVVFNHVRSAFFVEGVYDVTPLTVNAGTADVAIAATQSASISPTTAITLS